MTDLDDDDVFASTTNDQRASKALSTAVKSVQSSLFRRLGDRGYGKAGALAWLLCFAGNSASPKCERSREKLRSRPVSELEGILDICRGAVTAKSANDEWRAFASQVVAAIQTIVDQKNSTAVQNAFEESSAAFAIRMAVDQQMREEYEARGEVWRATKDPEVFQARVAAAQKAAGL